MQQQGYDKLSEDMQKVLDDTIKLIQGNADKQNEIVSLMLDKIKGKYNTIYGEINSIIDRTGTKVDDEALKSIKSIGTNIDSVIITATTDFNKLPDLVAKAAKEVATNPIDVKITFNGGTIANIEQEISKALGVNINDVKAASNVKGLIAKAKATDEKSVTDARAAYNKLTTPQKSYITSIELKQLTDAEDAIKKVDAKVAEEKAAAEAAAGKTKTQHESLTKTVYTYDSNGNIKPMTIKDAATADTQIKTVKKATGIGLDMLDEEVFDKNAGNEKRNQIKKKLATIISSAQATHPRKGALTKAEQNYNDLYKYTKGVLKIEPFNDFYIALANAMGVSYKWETKDKKKLTKASKEKILSRLHEYGYAKGTLGTKYDELNWTHQGEIIRRSDGAILRQLPAGTQVVPKVESANLMKWGTIDPNKFFADALKSMGTQNNVSNQIVNNYDALIRVEGNVDANVMDRLEDLGQRLLSDRAFREGLTKTVTKGYTREARKAGYKR